MSLFFPFGCVDTYFILHFWVVLIALLLRSDHRCWAIFVFTRYFGYISNSVFCNESHACPWILKPHCCFGLIWFVQFLFHLFLCLCVCLSLSLPVCERVPGACTCVSACEVEVVMEIFQWLLHFRILREGLLLNLELLLSSDWSVSPCLPVSAPQLWGLALCGCWESTLRSLFVQRALYPLRHYPACDFF